jgi:ATP synthase protein I
MNPDDRRDRLADVARVAQSRSEQGSQTPEPSVGWRLGQIGILGWIIVLPALGGMAIGRLIDRRIGGGITATAALLMLGICFGSWAAWRWMQRG